MPVEMIGWIAPRVSSEVVPAQGPPFDASVITKTARVHEAADFDRVLIGYFSDAPDGFVIGAHAASVTTRLGFLLAHRPGFVAPTLAARKLATLDQLTNGRLAVHIISGGSDADQAQEGDFTDKRERYERGGEYLDIMRRLWTSESPVDFEGRFYRVQEARSDVRPFQDPYPTLLFGGSSEGALEMGARFCDTFAMFGEPLKETGERIADYRRRCAAHGRQAKFNVSFRPIIAPTEGQAWDKARRILADIQGKPVPKSETASASVSNLRLMDVAAKGEIHDERFWTPIASATGGHGNTTCLVGTAEQVARSILKYYELGVGSFLLRGFDPDRDVEDFGRELIPAIRAGADALDRSAGQRGPAGAALRREGGR